MARDDYHVIVYQILAYLYTQLKNGDPVDADMLKNDSPILGINEKYWVYIMENLARSGYIEGLQITSPWGKDTIISLLDECQITPLGIEYLCDNSFLKKAAEFLKDVKAIVPFI